MKVLADVLAKQLKRLLQDGVNTAVSHVRLLLHLAVGGVGSYHVVDEAASAGLTSFHEPEAGQDGGEEGAPDPRNEERL